MCGHRAQERSLRRVTYTTDSAASQVFRAAILGSPVQHSLSPPLHRAGFAELGLRQWRYDAIECDAERLPGLVGSCGPDWRGFSVTMPGKAAAAAFAGSRTRRVQLLGVANTLYRMADGSWAAENTDVDGVVGALAAVGVTEVGPALLLGGGHTAVAMVAALAELGTTDLVLAGRRAESTLAAADLARRMGLRYRIIRLTPDEAGAAAADCGLVASTVPAGGADHLAAVLADVPVLFDASYHPWPTPLAAAGRPDRVTVTGLDMLLHQAFRQFELFTGHPAPVDAMRVGLLAASGVDLPLPVVVAG